MGEFVYRRRWLILIAWAGICAAMLWGVPKPDPGRNEHQSFLPPDSNYRIALRKLEKSFPQLGGLSEAVILFERPGEKLTKRDNVFINHLASEVTKPHPGSPPKEQLQRLNVIGPGPLDLALGAARGVEGLSQTADMIGDMIDWRRSPEALPQPPDLRNPLRSEADENGQAAIIRVSIPYDYITYRSTEIVAYLRDLVGRTLREGGLETSRGPLKMPKGLDVAVTGSAGYGYDYARFVEKSHDSTVWATLISVIVILLLVYRSPVAALVPLVAISMAAVVVIKVMNLIQTAGVPIGMAERIFVFVLMYGAGIDYSLLLVSRFREGLAEHQLARPSAVRALDTAFPAITASAATDALGILMLVFSSFLIFRTTGPVVAMALVVAMLASVTLVPALISLLGGRLFWPIRRLHPTRPGHPGRIWPIVAGFVVRRRGWVLLITLALLATPMVRSFRINWVYDALAGMDSESPHGVGNATRGVEIARQHWPIGEMTPMGILVEADRPLTGEQWEQVSRMLADRVIAYETIQSVRSLNKPLGRDDGDGREAGSLLESFARSNYLGNENRTIRLEGIFSIFPMNNRAMQTAGEIHGELERALADPQILRQAGIAEKVSFRVHLTGTTAQMLAIRETTQADYRLMLVLVLGVIVTIVFLLLRDILLTLGMVALIGVSYLSTLGLCAWLIPLLFGGSGLDWKIQLFLFVVMAAVGVDYNIFLAARLREEAQRHDPREAIRRAMIYTGPVISSCGLIMAATLGSLMAGRIVLLRQLGLALGLGMLMDTFVVRPLLLPAYAAVLKRTGKGRALTGKEDNPS